MLLIAKSVPGDPACGEEMTQCGDSKLGLKDRLSGFKCCLGYLRGVTLHRSLNFPVHKIRDICNISADLGGAGPAVAVAEGSPDISDVQLGLGSTAHTAVKQGRRPGEEGVPGYASAIKTCWFSSKQKGLKLYQGCGGNTLGGTDAAWNQDPPRGGGDSQHTQGEVTVLGSYPHH